MIQTMQSELFRIRKSRLFWACLVLAAFFVFALALTFYHNSVNGMLPVISLVSFTEFLFSDYSLIFPLTLFLCLYFTEDFHTGTYSITLSKGTSRVHLFFGKLLASWGGVLFFLFVCFGVAYLSILMMGASRYDIEYSFSAIGVFLLLNSGSEFIRNNSKVRFVKKAQYRVDKPDYAERAVTEALVNALIHRDYIVLGSEIHIDMFDDRVEITSPGGMFGGGSIQEYDIYSIRSMRRNPVIADLFHRMKYMERRGSGLRKIVSETEKLPGYTEAYKPEFSSTATDFRVILKNVNYIMCGASAHDTAHDAAHDTSVISKQNLLLEFCADPKSRDEMQAYIDVSSRSHFSKYYLKPLLSSGKLEMMFPDKPKSKNQKYTTVHSK